MSGSLGLQLFSSSTGLISCVCLVVTFIRLKVICFRQRYIDRDKYLFRFLYLVLLFIRRILILLIRKRSLLLILGWDGLGLSSYFLVVFYLNRSRNSGGLITVLSNRVGDVFIIIVILLLIGRFSTTYTPNIRTLSVRALLLLLLIILRRELF